MMCVCVCVREREREGGREEKKDGENPPLLHHHPTIVHVHIHYTDTLAHTCLLHTTLVWNSMSLWNWKTFQQTNQILCCRGTKRTIRKKGEKRGLQLHQYICTAGLNANNAFFLLLIQKNGINPSPIVFLGVGFSQKTFRHNSCSALGQSNKLS